ncbi:hypothetical protein uan_048 [Pseudomonas phage UAntarctica]|nr:hypothetical protein uan_048 [Pseudomonas phage UAntarctica]
MEREVSSLNYPDMPEPVEITDIESLRAGDPTVFEAVQILLGCLRNDMLTEEIQLQIIEAMSPQVRRSIVAKLAGLDASVLMTFKQQISLVDNVLRRIVTPEGQLIKTGQELGLSVKEAMTMSMKVAGMLTRDLPKVLTLSRIQRQEQVLQSVVDTMPKKYQDQFLVALERAELEAARQGSM